MTRQAVAKHLGVLDRVGLVHVTPAGREMRYRVDEAQLARAVAQLAEVGAAWDARLRRIKRIAEADPAHARPTPTHRRDEGDTDMVDILHRVGVKNSSPDKVYDALDHARRPGRLVDRATPTGPARSAACSSSASRPVAST